VKKERTQKYSKRLKDRTDWEYVDSLTDEDIDRAIADDPDAAPIMDEEWFKNARVVWPKVPISLRLDADIVKWFRKGGRGYQSRMNEALRAYMEGHRKKK
jgi:uncharacterized protein (DUF4415 family)